MARLTVNELFRAIERDDKARIKELEIQLATANAEIAEQAERLADIDGWEIDDSGVPEVGYRYRFLRQPVPNPKEIVISSDVAEPNSRS